MNPKVSIIIPFYNCSYVQQAIQSAKQQTYKNIEIIVVDDGSTKEIDKLERYKNDIVYLRKANGGTATALNHGIEHATGEYIAWLSSDDFFMPDKIAKQLKFMLANSYDASFTNYDIIDKNNHVITPCNSQRFTTITEVYKSYLNTNIINGCTIMLKKDLFKKFGKFNEVFKYTHDYEMWFRLLVNGIPIHYYDDSLTKFRTHDESGTSKYQHEMLNEMKLIESYYRPKMIQYIICNL
ncbi:glycosyltransferase [Bacillus sp. B1-b2]|uniref:glycosyltransferase n=1 Tax=Bacillus sp. B1-b2 TaxID=2653201 RepID=UPI0012613CB1|nr:glycosyltransferase [Bacillus sp. B1-b2]KAB7671178.1 glycosyltransferase [Bacillus sp. B1-b2]